MYKVLCKEIRALERSAQRDYYAQKFSLAPDSAAIYRLLSTIGFSNKRSVSKTAFDFFKPDDIIQYIADTYSIHPACSPSQFEDILIAHPIVPGGPTFDFHQISFTETLRAFNKALSTSKGNSPDGLKLRYLASAVPNLSTFFTQYYDRLLTCASYPSIWKTSLIVPLLKKPNPSSLGDVRPITNLCHLAKPFDSLISSQISAYFESNNCFSKFQSGCRPGFSTHTALIKLINDARMAIDRDEVTVLVLYDFRKAFNSVAHFLLLKILRMCGFSDHAMRFIYAYLINRSMMTEGSKKCPYTCGVGQGSGPGAIFFLIFVNAIFACFLFLLVILFVDDAQGYLHVSVDDINHAIQKANRDSAALVQWSLDAGIALNPEKVKAIVIGSRYNLRKINGMALQPLVVDGVVVPLSDCVKSLGLTISEDLRWQRHITDVITSISRILYFLNSKARYLPVKIKKLLAAQLLFPRFDYACITFLDLTVDLQNKLDRQLSKAIRFVFNCPKRTSTRNLRRKLNWMTLYQRRQYFLLTQTYKVLNTGSPAYLFDLLAPHFVDRTQSSHMETRQRPVFSIPSKSSRTLDSSFTYAAMNSWNKLDGEIRDSDSLATFKSRLKTHLTDL